MSMPIDEALDRYFRLRCHDDPGFRANLDVLRAWKTRRMLSGYTDLVQDEAELALLRYYIDEIFFGVELTGLRNPRGAVKAAQTFFSGTSMLSQALEFNTLAGELNQAIAEQLFDVMCASKIDDDRYVEACHRAAVIPLLERQLDVFEAFTFDLNESVNDKWVVRSIKLAEKPAGWAGLSEMHTLLTDGLQRARQVRDPQALCERVIRHERQVLEGIRRAK